MRVNRRTLAVRASELPYSRYCPCEANIGRGRCPCASGLYRDQPPRAGALRRLQAAPCCFGVPRVYGGRFRITARHDSENTTRSLTYASLSPLYNRAVRGVQGEQACAHGGSACTAFEAVRLSDQTYVASIRQAICTVTSDARLRSGEHHDILRTRPQRRRTRFGRPRCRREPADYEGIVTPTKGVPGRRTPISTDLCAHTTRKRDWMVGIAHGSVRPPSPRMVGADCRLQQAGRGEARPSVGPRPRVQ